MQKRENVHITDTQIKEVLNKRRLNQKRQRTSNTKPPAKKRLKMTTDDDDHNEETANSGQGIDMNEFLLLNMDTTGKEKHSEEPTILIESHD